MKRTFLAFSVFAMLASSAMAVDIPTTDLKNITATVGAKCQWSSPFALAFGSYDPFAAAATTGTTTAKFNCVRVAGTPVYKVWLSKTAGVMVHTNGGDTITYTLTQGGGSSPWPTDASGAVSILGTQGITSAGYVITVDGAISPGQDALVGSYSDTVVANINY